MAEFASKGVAGAALGTGIAGLSLGVLNSMGGLLGCGNGILGGWNRGCCDSDDRPVTRYEARKDHELAAKDSEIALLKANTFTDQKSVEIFNALNGKIEDLKGIVNQTVCGQAVTNQKLADNITFVDSKIDGVYREIDHKVGSLRCYVDATFVPGKLVMPLDAICPEAMPKCQSSTPAAASK